MTSETDAEFLDRMEHATSWREIDDKSERAHLFALARRGAAMQWRPIETAPASGEYLEYQPPCMSGRSFLPARVIKCGESGPMRKSTHWMPLPPPPAGEQE